MNGQTFGVIVGNRGFFPDELARVGRQDILAVLQKQEYGAVALTPTDTKHGAVETLADAQRCADLFKRHADAIDGIIVTLPNFGDEKGVLEAIRRSNIRVPILIHAEPDSRGQMTVQLRRDSFCGKISVCNNLKQAGIPFTLTASHTIPVTSDAFADELENFASICRVVRGLTNVRFGAVGTRPAAFNTVRYSEKILERQGISVEPIDMFEVFGRVDRLKDDDPAVREKLEAIKRYVSTSSVPDAALLKMAKFGSVIDEWTRDLGLGGTAIQCWTAIEEYFGVVPCTIMSMMSETLFPSACEVDITGLLAMYALQLASKKPSAILDWNNNYDQDPDKCILFHCSNLPTSFCGRTCMDYQTIIAGSVGKDNAYGAIMGRIKTGPATFCRTMTDDVRGIITTYVGQGEFVDDPVETFGGYGVLKINRLQDLMQFVCRHGFEHHVAVSFCSKAKVLEEAFGTYLGWEVYRHV